MNIQGWARETSILAAMLSTLGASACCTSGSGQPHSLTGRVVDPQNNAVRGVEVRLHDRVVDVTNGDGSFTVRRVPPDPRLVVGFSAPAFMRTARIYDTATLGNGSTVVIWPRATPTSLRASEGGKLAFKGGTIEFPPDAFVDATGRLVRGNVNVSMSVVDMTDPRQVASAPGDFTARMRDGSIRSLETLGLFDLQGTARGAR